MKDLLKNIADLLSIVVFLLFVSCHKTSEAQPSSKQGEDNASTLSSVNRGLNWIMDKYRNDNMHVMVAAHRANWKSLPENSLSAIQQCIDNGIEILELDVRLTQDEQLVLMHDKTLGRTATGKGEIKYLSLSHLKQQRLIDKNGNLTNETIPTLEEALLTAKGKALIMLDKSEYLLPWIEPVLDRTGTRNQIIFLEFNDLKKTENIYGELLEDVVYIPGIHHSNRDIPTYINDFERSPYKPSCYAFWIKDEQSEVLSHIPQAEQWGSRIWINTVDAKQCAGHTDDVSLSDPKAGWGWALDKGANILLTDKAAELLQYLQSKNRRN